MTTLYTLESQEYRQIDTLVSSIQRVITSENHLHEVAQHASQDMPASVRKLLAEFRGEHMGAALRIGGFEVDQDKIGPTPASTKPNPNRPILREDIYLALMACGLGTPFSFASQQGGHLTQNIVPMKSAEQSQLGASSKEELVWHTEDAFLDSRPDFIILFGMRNPQGASTTVAELPQDTDENDIEALFSKNFHFLPDPDHAGHLAESTCEAGRLAYNRMQELVKNPPKESILFGHRDRPYLRIDPEFMKPVNEGDQSVNAFTRLIERITSAQQDVVIESGELLIVDNHRAVHGRRPFAARYDGTDRWLKKINVTQDFKRKREFTIHDFSFAV